MVVREWRPEMGGMEAARVKKAYLKLLLAFEQHLSQDCKVEVRKVRTALIMCVYLSAVDWPDTHQQVLGLLALIYKLPEAKSVLASTYRHQHDLKLMMHPAHATVLIPGHSPLLVLQKKGARVKRAGPSGSIEPEDRPSKASKKRKAPSDAPGVCLDPPPPSPPPSTNSPHRPCHVPMLSCTHCCHRHLLLSCTLAA